MKRRASIAVNATAIVGAALIGVAARAIASDTAPAPDSAPAAEAGAGVEFLGITITGSADATYQYLSTTGLFSSGTPSRSFDFQRDAFTVHQAALAFALQPKQGFGGVVNVTAGRDALVIKSYPIASDAQFDLTQAYLQYATGPVTLLGGKFVTLAGAEVISEPQNTNYSRSILFGYAVPFTHTGLRGVLALDDAWTLTLGVVNGWDQITAPEGGKTAEFGLGWTPSKAFSALLDAYAGPEPVAAMPRNVYGERKLVDAVVTWNATEKLALIVNYDWGAQADAASADRSAEWSGVAGYVNTQWNAEWRTSVRAETFDDRNGYRTGLAQTWSELTLTLGYAPTKNVELRLEGRSDKSSASNAFVTSAGTASVPMAADVSRANFTPMAVAEGVTGSALPGVGVAGAAAEGATAPTNFSSRQNSLAIQVLFKF